MTDRPEPPEPVQTVTSYAKWVALLAVVIAVIAILGGPAYRIGVLPLKLAFFTLTIGLIGGGIALLLNAFTILRHWRGGPNRVYGIVGLAISLLVAGFIFTLYRTAQDVPRIHDITTDINNPPQFEAVIAMRSIGDNSTIYDPAVAPEQRAAYPDVKPIYAEMAPAAAFALAEKTARSLGWELVAVDPQAGTFEATDQTLWFGFKDDIKVRVMKDGLVTRIDLRSASRIGVSDVGANANRIRRFSAVYKDFAKDGKKR